MKCQVLTMMEDGGVNIFFSKNVIYGLDELLTVHYESYHRRAVLT